MAKHKPVPQSMEEAVEALLASLRPTDRQALRAVPADDLSERTWYLASWIRNEFGLWGDSSPSLRQRLYVTGCEEKDIAAGFDRPHPDDVSAAIIRAAWDRLQQDAEPDSVLSRGLF